MSRINVLGWVLMIVGFALCAYGYYFTTGHVALIDWKGLTPSWFSEFLPNLEAEVGMGLMIVAMIPAYWPSQRHSARIANDGDLES